MKVFGKHIGHAVADRERHVGIYDAEQTPAVATLCPLAPSQVRADYGGPYGLAHAETNEILIVVFGHNQFKFAVQQITMPLRCGAADAFAYVLLWVTPNNMQDLQVVAIWQQRLAQHEIVTVLIVSVHCRGRKRIERI